MPWGTRDIFTTSVGQGQLALAWVNGYSSVVARSPGATLLFDPVGLSLEALGPVDLVAVTHEHTDHWDASLVRAILEGSSAQVATTPFLASRLKSRDSRVRALRPGGRVTVGDMELVALPCDHPAREPLAFFVRTEDGVTLYHPSDGLPSPDMAQSAGGAPLDVLLYLGTSLETGAHIAELVQPRVVVTYRMEPRAARPRAREILARRTPHIPVKALHRYQVFRYPGDLAQGPSQQPSSFPTMVGPPFFQEKGFP